MIRLPRPAEREAGSAMLIAIMMAMVVAVLATTVTVLAVRSTSSAGDSRTAGVVKDLANAGLAEGVTFLRQTGVTVAVDATAVVPDGATACGAPTVNAASPAWTRSSAALVSAGSSGQYVVWVEKVAAPSGGNPGSYRVCSQGKSGSGSRTTSVRALYSPGSGSGGPYVVYGKGEIDLQGSGIVTNLPVFSETCVNRKDNKDQVQGTDLMTGLPAAAHSMLWVTTGGACSVEESIHIETDKKNPPQSDYVDAKYPYDTDQAGGPVSSDPDYSASLTALNAPPWSGSTLEPVAQTAAQFRARWGLADVLSTSYLAGLKATAQSQGNYYVKKDPGDVAVPDESNAVVYVDWTSQPGHSINLKGFNLGSFTTSTCSAGKSLILVIDGADVTANSGGDLRASVIVHGGDITKFNGNFTVYGGLVTDGTIDLTGNGEFTTDTCSASNPPPGGKPSVAVSDYVEYDRG